MKTTSMEYIVMRDEQYSYTENIIDKQSMILRRM